MISCRRSVGKCLPSQMTCRRLISKSPYGQVQPCCSSLNGMPVFAFRSSNYKFAIGLPTIPSRLLSSSPNDKTHERPQMFQLERIKERLEFTVPLLFNTRLDYTFYSKNVVLDDQIHGCVQTGLNSVMNYMGAVSIVARVLHSHIEARILNISPILEDGTVRLRWRVLSLGWLSMLNMRNFNIQHREKNLRWYDGYSVFNVNGEGLVYKVTIQKTMPDDSLKLSSMKDKTKEFVQRRVLPNPSPNCVDQQQQQFVAANCDSLRPPQQKRDEIDAGKKERQNEAAKRENVAARQKSMLT